MSLHTKYGNKPKKSRFFLKFSVASAVVVLLLAVFSYPILDWYFNTGACTVNITYCFNNIILIDKSEISDCKSIKFDEQKETYVYYTYFGGDLYLKFFESDDVFRLENNEKYSPMYLVSGFKKQDRYYLIFDRPVNAHMPITNKNHKRSIIKVYDIKKNSLTDVFETNKGEYLLYGDENKVVYFDSNNQSIVSISNDNISSILKTIDKSKKYTIQVFEDHISVNDISISL